MTPEQEQKNWRRLCGGKPPPAPIALQAPPDPNAGILHPERRTDPRYQWKPFRKTGYLDFLQRNGWLIPGRMEAHYQLVSEQAQHARSRVRSVSRHSSHATADSSA